ncbi:ABC transporter permease [Ideonella sp. DXS29W]|uniref:ABC transporter permease n=1 Tax=Ideonella lacteola TaxID=2984193 RepID=A0ABU9BI41_9BURK
MAKPDRAPLTRRWLRAVALPAVLLLALEVYARGWGQGSDSLAPPTAAAVAFGRLVADGSLWEATSFTLRAALTGLALGSVLGVAAGVLLGSSRRAAAWSLLSVELLRPMPSVALIPLALLVFGFGLTMESSVVAFATFWPMLVMTQAAVRQIEPRWLEVAAALGLSRWHRLQKIVLPSVLARWFVALRLGLAIALVVAVTVEIAANPSGMGYALILAQQSLDPAQMLAWLAWIGALGYALNALAGVAEVRLARRFGEVAT